jgi:hypothetical protein
MHEPNSNIKLFEKAINEQNLGAGTRISASAAIEETVERGVNIVRQLDAIVKNKFSNDPAKLAHWATASRTERPKRPDAPVVTDNPDPAPTGK